MKKLIKKLLASFAIVMLFHPSLAAELGDDGLHKADWMRDTFKDLSEDLAEANDEGKRLMLIIEQRGCIYCKKMHEEVFPTKEIADYIDENFFVVQINMFGDVEVTDFDGTTLSEKDMAKKWGLLFTPTILFFPSEVAKEATAQSAAVAVMPGAFGKYTTYNMLNWIIGEGYNSGGNFQKYHARMFAEQKDKLFK